MHMLSVPGNFYLVVLKEDGLEADSMCLSKDLSGLASISYYAYFFYPNTILVRRWRKKAPLF